MKGIFATLVGTVIILTGGLYYFLSLYGLSVTKVFFVLYPFGFLLLSYGVVYGIVKNLPEKTTSEINTQGWQPLKTKYNTAALQLVPPNGEGKVTYIGRIINKALPQDISKLRLDEFSEILTSLFGSTGSCGPVLGKNTYFLTNEGEPNFEQEIKLFEEEFNLTAVISICSVHLRRLEQKWESGKVKEEYCCMCNSGRRSVSGSLANKKNTAKVFNLYAVSAALSKYHQESFTRLLEQTPSLVDDEKHLPR